MRRWNIKTFYGSYGYIQENNDKTAELYINWNAYIPLAPHHKIYKSLRGAKIALGKLTDSYTLQDVSHLLNQEANNDKE